MTAIYDPARLPPEVIELDHELEARIKAEIKKLAELRWLYTLGPKGLLYNEDGTPALVTNTRLNKLQRHGDHRRRTFAEYGREVGRARDVISRSVNGYLELMRRQNDPLVAHTQPAELSLEDCVQLMHVPKADRQGIEQRAATNGWSIGHTKNVDKFEQRLTRTGTTEGAKHLGAVSTDVINLPGLDRAMLEYDHRKAAKPTSAASVNHTDDFDSRITKYAHDLKNVAISIALAGNNDEFRKVAPLVNEGHDILDRILLEAEAMI